MPAEAALVRPAYVPCRAVACGPSIRQSVIDSPLTAYIQIAPAFGRTKCRPRIEKAAWSIHEKWPVAAVDHRHLTALVGAAGDRRFLRYGDHAAVGLAGGRRRGPVEGKVPYQSEAAALVYG